MSKITPLTTRLQSVPERETGTRLEVMEITPDLLGKWVAPPFQRPLRTNAKVIALAEVVKNDGVIPGIVTLGIHEGAVYILDGQHRLHAFTLSGLTVAYADVRIGHFKTMGEMGEEFVLLNSSLVRLRPDDILRGLEASTPTLGYIRRQCPFVGYDMIRRGTYAPILSMSTALRAWNAGAAECPTPGGVSAQHIATTLTMDEARELAKFLNLAMGGWSRDPEYARLWTGLNLTLTVWLYRRTVLTRYSPKTPKVTPEQFGRALAACSAAPTYLDWLQGRIFRDRDRSPAYSRLKAILAKRLTEILGKPVLMPKPAWSMSHA